MINVLFLLLVLATTASAGSVQIEDEIVPYNDEFSFKNFTNWEFISRPEYDFSNKVIYATVFMNEKPGAVIFSDKTENVVFICCNLDNIALPRNSMVVNPGCGSQKRFEVQNDRLDWIVDEQNRPIQLIDEEIWASKGVSIDPEKIPLQKIDNSNYEEWLKKLIEIKSEIVADVQ